MNNKGLLINAIILRLNEQIIESNKKLCAENLHSEQAPLHGGDLFLKLALLSEPDIQEIARAAGI